MEEESAYESQIFEIPDDLDTFEKFEEWMNNIMKQSNNKD